MKDQPAFNPMESDAYSPGGEANPAGAGDSVSSAAAMKAKAVEEARALAQAVEKRVVGFVRKYPAQAIASAVAAGYAAGWILRHRKSELSPNRAATSPDESPLEP